MHLFRSDSNPSIHAHAHRLSAPMADNECIPTQEFHPSPSGPPFSNRPDVLSLNEALIVVALRPGSGL